MLIADNKTGNNRKNGKRARGGMGMSEILSYEEIKRRYPDEWLLIAEPELDDELGVIRGVVVAHSKNRDEVYRALLTVPGNSIAIEYTGEWPEDLAVAL
jgi:hypothetical protein